MRLPTLRKEVLEANLELFRRGLAIYTFGNASGISRGSSSVWMGHTPMKTPQRQQRSASPKGGG